MLRTGILAALLLSTGLIAGSSPARAEPATPMPVAGEFVPATTCMPCHTNQYNEWCASRHAAKGVECHECHGPLHSAQMHGCRRCHQAIHNDRLAHWPQVSRFDAEDGTDYMCIVCHNAHNSGLQKSLVGCYSCHGSAAHAAFSDMVHTHLASAVTPVHVDEFARERDGIVPWLMNQPRPKAAGVGVAVALGGYLLCFLLFLPFGYTGCAIWSRLCGRKRK